MVLSICTKFQIFHVPCLEKIQFFKESFKSTFKIILKVFFRLDLKTSIVTKGSDVSPEFTPLTTGYKPSCSRLRFTVCETLTGWSTCLISQLVCCDNESFVRLLSLLSLPNQLSYQSLQEYFRTGDKILPNY